MTFKWTYLAWALFMVATIVIAFTNGGPLNEIGGMTYLYGLSAIAAGALLILLVRSRRRPSPAIKAHKDEAFVGYPKDHVLGIFDDRPTALKAIDGFRGAGFVDGSVTLYAGAAGAAAIDSEGTTHGIASFTERSIEHLVADVADLEGYDRAIRGGAVVVSVLAPAEHERQRALRVFEAHGGHDVYYFGAMMTEQLMVDPTRTVSGAGGTQQQGDDVRHIDDTRRLSA